MNGADCIGRHLGQPCAGYQQIKWLPPAHWVSPDIRVREHTCSCRNVSYEFGMSGAGFVIQRTVRAADGLIVERTMPMLWTKAHDLWLSIFQGIAR